jgi:hypothetical protein
MTTLAEIRAKLLAQQTKSENKGSSGGDNSTYPFWNAPDNRSATIRFLPDADPNNVYFWVEKLAIRMPFQGVKGDHDREVIVTVPCMEMFGETCPVTAEIRPWWRDPSLEALARRYWKKRSYIFQGFVVDSPFEEKELPDNPIRKFIINKSIFEIIRSSLMNPEMEDLPIDYHNGRDFKLTKTKQGEYANYSTSNWSFKTRSLSMDEQDAVNNYSLFDLKTFLGKKPGPEEIEAIKEMFQASVNDEAYDPQKWGNYFKPYGLNINTSDAPKPTVVAMRKPITPPMATPAPAPKPVMASHVEEDEDSVDDDIASSGVATLKPAAAPVSQAGGDPKQGAMEILRRIKEKRGMA